MIRRITPDTIDEVPRRIKRGLQLAGYPDLEITREMVISALGRGELIVYVDDPADDAEYDRFLLWVDPRGDWDGNRVVYIRHIWAPSRTWRAVLRWINEQLAERAGLANLPCAFPVGTPIADLAQSVVRGRTDIIPGHSVVRLGTALDRIKAAAWERWLINSDAG